MCVNSWVGSVTQNPGGGGQRVSRARTVSESRSRLLSGCRQRVEGATVTKGQAIPPGPTRQGPQPPHHTPHTHPGLPAPPPCASPLEVPDDGVPPAAGHHPALGVVGLSHPREAPLLERPVAGQQLVLRLEPQQARHSQPAAPPVREGAALTACARTHTHRRRGACHCMSQEHSVCAARKCVWGRGEGGL